MSSSVLARQRIPVAVNDPACPWNVTTQGNQVRVTWSPRGQSLSYRVPASNIVVDGHRVTADIPNVGKAIWETYTDELKLRVEFTGKPPVLDFSIPAERQGVAMTPDGTGALSLEVDGEAVGTVVAPWFRDATGKHHDLGWVEDGTDLTLTLPDLDPSLYEGAVLDPTTVVSGGTGTGEATAFGHQRALATEPGSEDTWTMLRDGQTFRFYRSTDRGVSWVDSGFTLTSSHATPNGSMHIGKDGYLRVVFTSESATSKNVQFRLCERDGSAWTVLRSVTVYADDAVDHPDVVGHRHPQGGHAAHVVFTVGASVRWRQVPEPAAPLPPSQEIVAPAAGATGSARPCIDLYHNGDGLSVSSPHLWVGCIRRTPGPQLTSVRGTYSSGGWTWATPRNLSDDVLGTYITAIFDGSRFIVAGRDQSNSARIRCVERNSSDTFTNPLPTKDAPGSVTGLSLTYDESQHLYVYAQSSSAVWFTRFDRDSGAWDDWTTVESATIQANTVSAKRGWTPGRAVEAVYTTGSVAPFDVRHDLSVVVNRPPNMPLLKSRANFDAADDATFVWQFSDDDPNDTQSAYWFQVRRVSDNEQVYVTGFTASGAQQHTVPGGTLSNDVLYLWWARTWDAAGEQGPLSDPQQFLCAEGPSVTVVSPADSSTVDSPEHLSEITYSDPGGRLKQAHRVRLLVGASPVYDSGTVQSSGGRTHLLTGLENGQSYEVEWRARNSAGVWGPPSSNTFSVAYTPPEDPVVTLTAGEGFVTVAIVNPSGAVETTSNRVERLEAGSWIVVADSVEPDGSFDDWFAPHGSNTYRVTAIGTNTATASVQESVLLELAGVTLFDVADPAGTAHRFQYDGEGRDENWQAEGSKLKPVGRTRPVAYFGEMDEEVFTARIKLTGNAMGDADRVAARSLGRSKSTLCWRDPRRKGFGVVFGLPVSDAPAREGSTTITLDLVDYREGV